MTHSDKTTDFVRLREAQAARLEQLTGHRPKLRSPWGWSALAIEKFLDAHDANQPSSAR